jgi:SAM-dependent methyltransferase
MAGGDFETLPYPSLPQAYTQPARLAAMAILHGVTAPAADKARVLELGCASGGNIIPLAARFSDARFIGVDLSARHVADGMRRIAQLGLGNVELRQGDVVQLSAGKEKFDYVICHGLYSWVPPDVQQAILKLISSCLAANGVAAVSYNVLPGWHLRNVVRDICLRHAGANGTPLERVARARQALNEIADRSSARQPYGALLRQEAKRLSRQPAAYILGEFLSETNAPLSFPDFCARAARHNLRFVCEADLDASAKQALEGGNASDDGQTLDFISGRPFRRSLLVHAAQPVQPVSAKHLRGLHVLGHGNGGRFASINTAFPNSVAVDGLIATLDEADGQHICEMVLAAVAAGQANISTLPVRAGRADAGKLSVLALNRMEAAAGQPWLSSLHHEAVALSAAQAALVRQIDGTRDRAALIASVASAMPVHFQSPAEFVDSTLTYLERNGVLLAH